MLKNFFAKIKNYGVGKAINALDNLEQPLGDKLEAQRKKIEQLDSYGLSKWIVDEVQDWLRSYFKIPQPQPKSDSTEPTTV